MHLFSRVTRILHGETSSRMSYNRVPLPRKLLLYIKAEITQFSYRIKIWFQLSSGSLTPSRFSFYQLDCVSLVNAVASNSTRKHRLRSSLAALVCLKASHFLRSVAWLHLANFGANNLHPSNLHRASALIKARAPTERDSRPRDDSKTWTFLARSSSHQPGTVGAW